MSSTAPKLDFMRQDGLKLFLHAREAGYSVYASLFVVSHAVVESGFGQSKKARDRHNYFSLMADNKLIQFSSMSHHFDEYTSMLDKKFPGMTMDSNAVGSGSERRIDGGLYARDTFGPDDVNKALNQFRYYPTKTEHEREQRFVYNNDPWNENYGRSVVSRMSLVGNSMLVFHAQGNLTGSLSESELQLFNQYFNPAQIAAAIDEADRQLKLHLASPVETKMRSGVTQLK